MNEEMKLLLEAVQLIVRDRTWNNQSFEVQSKITDANISKILNPIKQPTLKERTAPALAPETEEDLALCLQEHDNLTGEAKKDLNEMIKHDVLCEVSE